MRISLLLTRIIIMTNLVYQNEPVARAIVNIATLIL